MFLAGEFSRRRMLVVGTLAASTVAARRGVAEEQCVVGCWGEDYARLLNSAVDEPLSKSDGIEVVQSVADEGPRISQLFAQHHTRRGTLDVACLGALNGVRAATAGLAETLDETRVPNLRHILSPLRNGPVTPGQFVPQMYTPLVLVGNLATGETFARSWADLLKPRWKGKTGVISSLGSWMIIGAALATSGDPGGFDQAKEYLLKLKANGLRHYLETDDIRSALRSGEIDVGITWLSRAAMWRVDGYPMQGCFPEEGTVVYTSGMVMPGNAPNGQIALKYLNAMLAPTAQKAFAERMGYSPTVENVVLSGKTAEMLTLPKDAKIVQPDYANFAVVQNQLNDWWVKNIDR